VAQEGYKGDGLVKLWQYVQEHTIRGACQCGHCYDAVENPEKHQPEGHTVDMVFFEVAKSHNADKSTFVELVGAEFPHWLNGEEQTFLNMGADIGDQGTALMAMALGVLLGTFELHTPKSLGLGDAKAMELAGMGLLGVKALK
jgi:hypothetical protein